MRAMMKDFNRYVQKKLKIENVEELKKKVVTQEELGLPTEMSGEDLLKFIQSDKPKEPLVSAEWISFDTGFNPSPPETLIEVDIEK